jgi:hypothetical protein
MASFPCKIVGPPVCKYGYEYGEQEGKGSSGSW